MSKEYALQSTALEALAIACVRSPWSPKHAALLENLCKVDGYRDLRYVTQRDHFSPRPGRLLDEAGKVVAADYRAWACETMAAHGGDVTSMWKAFSHLDWTVTGWRWSRRYYWVQTGSRPCDGLQVEIVAEQEFPGVRLFRPGWWTRPMSDTDVLNPSFPSDPDPAAVPYDSGRYRLEQATDVAVFIELGQQLHEDYLRAAGSRKVLVTPGDGAAQYEARLRDVKPRAFEVPWTPRRWFDDWGYSSAGRSGAVAGHHWAFSFNDWDGGAPGARRQLSMVPIWSHTSKIAPIKAASLNNHELYGRLQRLDERTGKVPFNWFFYLLHGNLVKDAAGHRVLAMAERGDIVLPEHDYQVLKRWAKSPYGF